MSYKRRSVFNKNVSVTVFYLLLSISALAQDKKKGFEVLINFSLLNEKQIKEIQKLLNEQAMHDGITRQVLIAQNSIKGITTASRKTIADLPEISKTNTNFISRVDFLNGIKSKK